MPTVLLVEDDPRFVHAIRYFLERKDYRVVVAGDGVSGLNAFLSDRPDVLVTDNVLPRMMGFELVARVRRLGGAEDLPILMVSGFDRMSGLDEGAEQLVDHFLAKPFLLTELEQVLSRLLDASSPEGAARLAQRRQRVRAWRRQAQRQAKLRTPPPTAGERERLLRMELERAAEHMRDGGLLKRHIDREPPRPPDAEEELARQGDPTPHPATAPAGRRAAGAPPASPRRRNPSTPPTSAGEQGRIVPPGQAQAPEELDAVGCLARCLGTGFHGIAHFRREGGAMTMVFRRGIPCYAEMATIDQSFGSFLHAQGHLSPEAHAAFVAAWRDGKRPPPAGFLTAGGISADQLIDLLSTYVAQRVADLLEWTGGSYAFRGDDSVVDLWPPLDVNPIRLVLRWVERTHSDERLRRELEPFLGSAIVQTAAFARLRDLLAKVVSTPQLGQIARAGSVADLLRTYGRGMRAAAGLVWSLVLLGLIELSATEG